MHRVKEEKKKEQGNVNGPVLRISGITNIHYEAPDEFAHSVLSDAYEKAFCITKEIVRSTETALRSRGGDGTKHRNNEQIYNIIFFTGERGAGKTSTMLSYMEFLKDYYRNSTSNECEKVLGKLKFEEGNYMFTGIEYIDAASLDIKEDILGSVLSKMLKKWNEEEGKSRSGFGIVRADDYDYKKRQIRIQFNEIYERLKDLRSEKDPMQTDSDMFLETLDRLSLTWNVKQAFQKLVEEYLDIMVYQGSGKEIWGKNHFLVISIDDIDMNINHGFMLLEQIRKYLMVPNVIVLLSANYEQLEKVCYNHYFREFKPIKDDEETKDYINRLSREYIEKMVPEQRQIRLMSGRLWKFFNQDQLTIRTERSTLTDDKKGETVTLQTQGTLHNIIKEEIQSCLDLKFSPTSKCMEYLMPETLRELCGWIVQISELAPLLTEEEVFSIDTYQDNLRWFAYAEFPRLCRKHLFIWEQKILEMLDMFEASNQIKIVKDRLEEELGEKNGSLLELLSIARRKNEDMQKFASMCLIYFSMKLTEALIKVRRGKAEEEKQQNLKILLQYFSKPEWGIWGKWERKMLIPMFRESGADQTMVRIGYTKFAADNECLNIDLKSNYNDKDIVAFMESNAQALINYQYLLLFYRLNKGNSEECIWQRINGTKIRLIKEYGGIFSLSGFILNLLEGAKLVCEFRNKFLNLLPISKESYNLKEVKRKWNEISILSGEVLKAMKEPLIPIDNVEFLVYIGEKVQDQFENEAYVKYSREAIKNQIRRFFSIIQECLDEYDKVYGSSVSERFRKFPLLMKIFDDGRDSFINLLIKSIECHVVPYNLEKREEEW